MYLSKSISLDTLLGLIVMIVPAAMSYLTMNSENPFLDGYTSCVVSLMSMFLMGVIWLNRKLHIPTLEIFILVYVFFWHLRFLTLALFPEGELVLTRRVVINHEIFNDYVWIVFISLVAAVAGIISAHLIRRHKLQKYVDMITRIEAERDASVLKNIRNILGYCLIALAVQVVGSSLNDFDMGPPTWIGYLNFCFPFSLIVLLVILVLINKKVSSNYKAIFSLYLFVYIVASVIAGSRSLIMFVVLWSLFLAAILKIKIQIKFRHLIFILLLGLISVSMFVYGTYQRQLRSIYGTSITLDSVQNVIENMSSESDKSSSSIFGLVSARSGYLDYSADMFANSEYGQAVSFENELKSIIKGYIPGELFEDSRKVSNRLRPIYEPDAIGYLSDALGAVGESFLLFGYAFPFAIAFMSFSLTYLFYAASGNIAGFYLKFSVGVWLMTWWNSFGLDWLFVDMGRQIVFGGIAIMLIFRQPNGIRLRKWLSAV